MHDLFDQQIAERNPAQAVLAVGDRIENRAVGAGRVAFRRIRIEQRRHGGADTLGKRDFDEYERLIGQCRMKKREAAPVAGEPAVQIGPAGDFMHGFVLNEFFEDQRGRAPVYAFEPQKAAVEPRAEQVFEVRVDTDPVRIRLEFAQQTAAQIDQRRRGAGRYIQPPEEFLARRFDCVLQGDQILRCRILRVDRGGDGDPRGDRREIGREQIDERLERIGRQCVVGVKCIARECRPGYFAAFGQQCAAQCDRFARLAFGGTRAVDRRGDPAQQIFQERSGIHRL
jgi:hypothetical protein